MWVSRPFDQFRYPGRNGGDLGSRHVFQRCLIQELMDDMMDGMGELMDNNVIRGKTMRRTTFGMKLPVVRSSGYWAQISLAYNRLVMH